MSFTGAMLRFEKAKYERKIINMDTLNGKLKGHRVTLENLKSQIPNFWESEEATKYTDVLNKVINKVKESEAQVENLKQGYVYIVTEEERYASFADDMVKEAGDVAAKVISLGTLDL